MPAGLARRLAGPDDPVAIPVTAGDFRTFLPQLGPGDAIVGISASGEFRDVVGVFEEVRGRIPTVAIVHVPGSSLTRIADHVVLSGGGAERRAGDDQDLLLDPVGDDPHAGRDPGRRGPGRGVRGPPAARPITPRRPSPMPRRWSRDSPRSWRASSMSFVVGGGLAYPAALEAALKLKEMALVHAEASETWEMASGPATMVGPGMVVISLAPDGAARSATDDVVRHCREWGARIIEVAPTQAVAGSTLLAIPAAAEERFAPLTVVPPVALLAYVLAGLRGATPDRPGMDRPIPQPGPQPHRGGLSAMDPRTGKRIQAGRLFDPASGRTIVVALSHGVLLGPSAGMESLAKLRATAGVLAAADALMVAPGLVGAARGGVRGPRPARPRRPRRLAERQPRRVPGARAMPSPRSAPRRRRPRRRPLQPGRSR